MLIRKGYRFALKTNRREERLLRSFAGCSRFIWNKALAIQKERLDAKKKVLKYEELAGALVGWKKSPDTSFLNDAPSQSIQQTLKHLDRAMWDGLKKEKGFPVFKKKGRDNSFRYPQGFQIDGSRVFLPKVGWVLFRKSRDIRGTPKNVTVSEKCGRWFVSIQVEQELETPIHPSRTAVGIDRGVAMFAALSNGETIESPKPFESSKKRLAMAQRSLSRKTKFSENWKKQREKIVSIHNRIANVRRDFLQKASTIISKNHAMIVIEELDVKNMTKSVAGTLDSPGTHVKAKRGLNRRILDQGWSEFARELEYKQSWRGGILEKVPPQYTSQRCSVCGHTDKRNRKTQSSFACVSCGHTENADINAAKTILAVGLTAIACGGSRRGVGEAGTRRMGRVDALWPCPESSTLQGGEDVNYKSK